MKIHFDYASFWEDVMAYAMRHKLHVEDLVAMADIDHSTIRSGLTKHIRVNINHVMALAYVADLDLNKYNKAQEYLNVKAVS